MPDVLAFPVIEPPTTVGGVISIYLVHTRHEQSPRTYADRKRVLTEFEGSFGHVALAAAKPYQLKIWVDAQRDRWASAWTRKRVAGSVQSAFNWCVKLGIIDRNPFHGVSWEPGERGEPMESAEFQAMLRATRPVFRRVLVFLRFAGCRPGEMAKGEWRYLDAQRSCLFLPDHKTKKTARKPRRIMLHSVLLKLLAWISRRSPPEQQFIFTNSRGGPWTRTAIHWRLEQIRKKAGISRETTCYGLRHKFCTDAVIAGVDLPTVAELAGHARIATTMTYVHLAQKTDRLQAELAKVFKKH